VAGLLVWVVGCGHAGLSQNPSYFPYWKPTGDIVRTHAKPPGFGYFADFDPKAFRIEVRPKTVSTSVGGHQVLIATVYDKDGQPRRGRRVEWMLEGKGHIVEVDESGYAPGRGYKVDNRYAVSYTEYFSHTITRGNNDPTDDFMIRPGQSWCVISSPVEGDTQVTAYAPEIFNWDRNQVTVQVFWLDVDWVFPPPSQARGGTQHQLTTQIVRRSDRVPLANYKVRYTVQDGPPAIFLPNQQRSGEAVSDSNGNATVTITQPQPTTGRNRIGIEIIRPPDTYGPTGPGIIIGRGETFVDWTAANISLAKTGPASAAVGQVFTYTITVANPSTVPTEPLTVRDPVPEGLTFVSSQPNATVDGRTLVWTLPPLQPGQSNVIQASFRADRPGTVTNVASVTSQEGLRADNQVVTQISQAGLAMTMTGPATATVNQPIPFQITVTNTGTGPANNVVIRDEFDKGLVHESGDQPLELGAFNLGPGESRTATLNLVATQEGTFTNRAQATADGGLRAQASHAVQVMQPRLKVSQTGPVAKYVRGKVVWQIVVQNGGPTELRNVVVRDLIPAEVQFLEASNGGQPQGAEIVWNLGNLAPQEERRLTLSARADKVTARAVNIVQANADPNMQERSEQPVEIRGAPGIELQMTDTKDPIMEGEETSYEVRVTNTGTLVADGIRLTFYVPPELRVKSAVGPGNEQGRFEVNKITFPARDGLVPGATLQYTIIVEAVRAGDARFKVEMKTNLGPDTVTEEEPTTILPRQ
jgi:uncharacterized repeat protein (TIGR01451 family)